MTYFRKILTVLGASALVLLGSWGAASATTTFIVQQGGTATTTFQNGYVVFSNGTTLKQSPPGSSSLFWDNSNFRLGVGNTSPSLPLDVTGSIRSIAEAGAIDTVNSGIIAQRTTNDSVLAIGYRTTPNVWALAATYSSTGAYKPIAFYTSDSERLRIDTAGNVGIGSTTPGSLLSVGGNLTGTNFFNNSTTTKNGVGGYDIAGGCFSINGVCVGSNSSSGTVTQINTTWPVIGGPITTTGTLSFGGLSTSSPIAAGGAILYATGVNTLASTATSTLQGTGPISVSNAPYIIGASGAVVSCATASGSAAGCLAAADFSRFNSATTTFSTGLTYTLGTNAVTVNTSQSISTLSNLTTNGIIETSGGVGTLGVEVYPLSVLHGGTGTTTSVVSQLFYGGSGSIHQSVATSSIGVSAGLTTSGTLGAQVGGSALTLKQVENRSFSYATSSAWTGTTTIALEIGYGEVWNTLKCFTDTGTLNVQFGYGTASTTLFNASTTIGTVAATPNNTMTAGNKVKVDIGTPASTPTTISCTVNDTI